MNQNAEIVACILSFRKSRRKPNLESTSKHGGENGSVLSMCMQVILDSLFATLPMSKSLHHSDLIKSDSISREISCTSKIDP